MSVSAVDRLEAEIDAFCAKLTQQILDELSEYRDDPTASVYLGHSIRENADQVLKVFRDVPNDVTAARNVGLMTATATTVPLDTLLRAYRIALAAFVARLQELAGPDEDVSAAAERLRLAHVEVAAVLREEYLAAKARQHD